MGRETARARRPAVRTSVAVQGARVHNLKDVSVEIPRDSLVVITGLSGSGSRASRSTRSTPKGSGAISNRSRATPSGS
jgi:ABC-type proline/glycine betaine transport system ATPase subunit